jgi:hypothetical protein
VSAAKDEEVKMAMTCINLAERFGHRYRIGWEASGATKRDWPRAERPWLMRLRCRAGHVAPYGGDVLQAVTDRPRLGTQLRALPFVLAARGDAETVVRFHVDHLSAVLAILRPYQRRRLTEARRAELGARLARVRPTIRPGALAESDFPAPGSTPGVPDGGEGVSMPAERLAAR